VTALQDQVTTLQGQVSTLQTDVTTLQGQMAILLAPTKKVFLTADQSQGDLGGWAGADAKCQAAADLASLPGDFRAWISDSHSSPAIRFNRSQGPYVLVDAAKTVVADNWADLTDGSLQHMINVNENGTTVTGDMSTDFDAWTGTLTDGEAAGDNCTDWASADGSHFGVFGCPANGCAGAQWTIGNMTHIACSEHLRLYCFEQ
jgi:hypothetical protein